MRILVFYHDINVKKNISLLLIIDMPKKDTKHRVIKVAILANEPLGWGSGKHYFPVILDGYTWTSGDTSFKFSASYIFDKDIIKGKLNTSNYDALLIPGGGVGDGQAVVKGFNSLRKVRIWKKYIQDYIKAGGGCIGICGGTALITGLITESGKNPSTFYERQYNKSSIGISCVMSYYKELALPIFNILESKHPQKIGAMGYIFSFAPGVTKDGVRIHTGGAPIDFKINKDNPIFSDYSKTTLRTRWWGGPALIIPENPDRTVKILARYPVEELSQNKTTRIYAWKYKGGFFGILSGILKALKLIETKEHSIKNLFIYSYFLAGDWIKSDKLIELNYSNKPCMTAEIYPNENKGRILLCTSHPEYMIWWDGHIEEVNDSGFNCIGEGLYRWKDIKPLSETVEDELTYTWWVVRRITAWAAKVPDDQLPPITKGKITEEAKAILSKNIFWDGSLIHQMKNI
jgi:glutamine amidotransferase-like uncharacterized protein